MKSYFIEREGGRLYKIVKTDQQEYVVAFVLNNEKSFVTNPMRTFLALVMKSPSKFSSAFHASPPDWCTMT
jgi:hypothetical protein